jgi:DNA invertase Pin-like site-specific DNA recombinase
METLRFAPIIRVSTEKQEQQGESLTTQEKQIRQYVELLHGTIPDTCWQYKGQEHATPGQERKRLEKLLTDSGKGIFDAVICCDASRWSRDNLKSKEGLKILRDNGIRFFVSTMEYDLYNPEHSFYLGVSAEIGELQARQQARKSIINRIERAKQGMNASGALPYGRTFDVKTKTWGIDQEKKQIIEKCAERYLEGESFKDIAKTYNMDFSNLWSILNRHCGDTWECRFKYENIDETVIMKIPRLLDDKTIKAIHRQGLAKRCWNHGSIKNKYLLGRMIFCANCGYTMTGYTSISGRRYYRHARIREQKCYRPKFVYALELENSVLIHLITTIGDKDRIKQAIEQATPDLTKVEALTKEQTDLANELKRIEVQKEKIIDAVVEGKFTDAEVNNKMEKLRTREGSIHTRIDKIKEELNSIPDPDKIKHLSTLAIHIMSDVIRRRPQDVFKKSYVWKRKLVESAFAGTDINGKRLGVYVNKTEGGWSFEIRGTLESTILSLPLSDEYLENAFGVDTEEELAIIRLKVSSLGRELPTQTSYTINGTLE